MWYCVYSLFQALLANISAMYAAYHGPDGLKEIGCNVHDAACLLALGRYYFSFLNFRLASIITVDYL